ncbi:MAG: hypothetical protein AB1324_01940 [Candidatus Micrarchaeota archaeon]
MSFIPKGQKLMLEGIRKFGLAERVSLMDPGPLYFGISVSRAAEPLDQLDVLLLSSRLMRSGADCPLTVFVAGRFAQLNGRPASELIEGEEGKIRAISAASRALRVPVSILRTDDLWCEPGYWSEVESLRELRGIISERKGERFSRTAESLEQAILSAMPPGLMDAIGPLDSPSLYRLFEVAEAAWLSKSRGVSCKAGPSSEEEYDFFIRRFMGTIQLRQPLDLRSSPQSPRPIIPYIAKEGESRLLLSDTKKEVDKKISALAQRAAGTPLDYGGFMNPFARLAALAVEAAACADSVPVRLNGSALRDGAGAVAMLEKAGTASISRFAPVVSECLWAYLLKPVRESLGAPS